MRGSKHLRIRRSLALACAAAAALAVAGSARLVATGEAATPPPTVAMTAPATAVNGSWFDYAITLTYSGTLNDVTAPFTVTDALPSGVNFISLGITAGTCTQPQPGQNGTVACTMSFAPDLRTVTIRITVEAQRLGSVTNTVQVSNGETASATTTIAPLPAGSFNVTMTGPESITIPLEAAPERFGYTIAIDYVGPPLTGRVRTRFTDQLPDLVRRPGVLDSSIRGDFFNCTFPASTAVGGSVSCDAAFSPTSTTVRFVLQVRPTGETGRGTSTLTLDTGDSASWDTRFVAAPPPPPPPLPGPPAAPAQTVTETFTEPGQAEPEAVPIAQTAETAQVAVTWPANGSSFDVTNFQLVSGGKVVAKGRWLASVERLRPGRLKITKRRKVNSVDARVTNLRRGKLKFKVVARKVSMKTKVRVIVRQSKKRARR